jgi:hypothetical protein
LIVNSKKIGWLLVFIAWVFLGSLLALSASAQETQSPLSNAADGKPVRTDASACAGRASGSGSATKGR